MPTLIGVAGGSASGKTTFAKELSEAIGAEKCQILFQDSYYKDQSGDFDGDGESINYDHPDAIDFRLLALHLKQLKERQQISIPRYDFKTHKRLPTTLKLAPREVVILDGILILNDLEVRKVLSSAVFVDTPEALRFQRRLDRDVKERARTPEGVKKQFFNHVKPMHDLFVEPSRRYADRIYEGDRSFQAAIQDYLSFFESKFRAFL